MVHNLHRTVSFKACKTNRTYNKTEKQLSVTVWWQISSSLLWRSLCCTPETNRMYANYTSIKTKQNKTTSVSYLVWPSNCLRGALPLISKSWTPPSSLPATRSLPSCRKVAQYAVSLNREKVFIGSWEYRP